MLPGDWTFGCEGANWNYNSIQDWVSQWVPTYKLLRIAYMIWEIKFTVNFQWILGESEEYLVEDGFSLFVRTYHMHQRSLNSDDTILACACHAWMDREEHPICESRCVRVARDFFQKQQELQKKGIQMVILRLGSATDKMIEVFKQQYGNNSPGALKLHVFDPRKDAKRLRCIVSGSSVASYGSSISKLSQAKAIQCV